MADIQQYINIASNVIAVAAAVAAVVPIPQAAGSLLIARKIIDVLAINVGNAKNARPVCDAEQKESAPAKPKAKRERNER